MRVLCIADGSEHRNGLPYDGLSKAALGGSVSITMSGPEGIVETLRRSHFDIVVIQQTVPDVKLVRHIRKSRVPTPVMILVQQSTPHAVAELLSIGADDCVPASVDPTELMARLQAIVRRVSGHDSRTLHIGRMTVGVDRREVHIDSKLVPLTRREYDLLELLALRKTQVLSKETVLDSLYAGESEPYGKVIDVMICKIRKKMRTFGVDEPFTTLWGIGYRLNEKAFAPLGARNHAAEALGERSAKESCLPVMPGINILTSSTMLDLT